MSRVTTGLPLVYRPDKAHVWVEDAITRDYLQELWQDVGIVFHVGGGHQTVRAVAQDALAERVPNVVGVIDRDFGATNAAQWTNPASGARVMTIPVHEIENYLLEEDALAGCDLNTFHRSAADVATYLRRAAGLSEWQVAGAKVVAGWRDLFQGPDFPKEPTRVRAADHPSALAYLSAQPWYGAVVARANGITATGEPDVSLTAAHTEAAAWLAGGQWKTRYPAKALFRDVRGYIYDPTARGAPPTGVQPDIDVAVAVATWQRGNGRVPPDLQTLQAVIHTKAGV